MGPQSIPTAFSSSIVLSLFLSGIGLILPINTTEIQAKYYHSVEIYFGPGKIFIQYSVTWVNIGHAAVFQIEPFQDDGLSSFTVVIFVSYLNSRITKGLRLNRF